MSGLLAKEKEAVSKEAGKLKKILMAVKKFLAKEFLWVLFVLLLALPVAFLLEIVVRNYSEIINNYLSSDIKKHLKISSPWVFMYLLSIAGIYFARAVVGAISELVKKAEN